MCCIDSHVSVTKLRLLMDKAQAQKKGRWNTALPKEAGRNQRPPPPQGRLVKHHLTKGRGTGSATQRKTAFPSPFGCCCCCCLCPFPCVWCCLPSSVWVVLSSHFPFVWCRFLPPHVGCLHSLLLWAGAAVFPTPAGGGAFPFSNLVNRSNADCTTQKEEGKQHHRQGKGRERHQIKEGGRETAAPA